MGNNRSKVPDLEKLVKGGRKKFVRYEEGAMLYSMGVHTFQQLHMFILKLAGKILLLPLWLILFVIGLAVKMTVQTYAVVRGILGFTFTLLIIATAYCYHDWVQVAFLFVLSAILYLILFAGVLVDTVLDMTRECIIDFILS
jgi:hypothetical protein